CVVGVDIAEAAIEHARRRYRHSNLDFQASSAGSLPSDEPFDVITCFEVIEHVDEDEQHALLTEVSRVLSKDGLFVISTPNKPVYCEAGGGPDAQNPFHIREMTFSEFRILLESYFGHILWYGQQMLVGNYMCSLPVGEVQASGKSVSHGARMIHNELIKDVPS